MDVKTVQQFVATVKQKMVEQNIQLEMVRSMQASAMLTSKTFKKLHRNITKQSAFYQYYEAKLALDTKDSRDLDQFRRQLQDHIKKTERMLRVYEKPYKKQYGAYQKAQKAHLKKVEKLDSFTQKLQQKENLYQIAPEEKLQQQISQMKDKQAQIEQDSMLAQAAHTNQQGELQKQTNEFVKQLQIAYQNILKFEKMFFEHVSNIEDITVFFKRVQEISTEAQKIDVLQQSSKFFNETLKLQDIVKEAVFDTKTQQKVKEMYKQFAETKRLYQQEVAAEKERQKQLEKQQKEEEAKAAAAAAAVAAKPQETVSPTEKQPTAEPQAPASPLMSPPLEGQDTYALPRAVESPGDADELVDPFSREGMLPDVVYNE